MTSNQIAYNKLLEDQRSHLANEEIQRQANAEVARHNVATEEFSKNNLLEVTRHNFETERISAQDSINRYNASIYAADSSRQASMYAADVAAAAHRYAADQSAAATRYAASTSAAASRYVADKNAEASKYVADQNKAASTLRTNVEASLKMSEIRSKEKIAEEDRYAAKMRNVYSSDSNLQSTLLRGAFDLAGSLASTYLKKGK